MMKYLMSDNKNQGRAYFNPLINMLETDDDVWLVYEYLYAPCESLLKGITVEQTEHKYVYRNL